MADRAAAIGAILDSSPLPTDGESWGPQKYIKLYGEYGHLFAVHQLWKRLAPFFESLGYLLYVHDPWSRHGSDCIFPTLPPLRHPKDTVWPWPRYYLDSDDDTTFHGFWTMRVYAAQTRDSRREVIIRLAATADDPLSVELQIYRRLNSALAKADPRIKRTLPTLEFINYEGMTFVVMPRWGNTAMAAFTSVQELLDMGIQLFESLAFLHDLRIAHGDILLQNTVVNALYSIVSPACQLPTSTLRRAPDVMYAFIDYDKAMIFPVDTDISATAVDRVSTYGTLCGSIPDGGRGNPFYDDVTCLASSLESFLRVIQFEELGPRRDVTGDFFDTLHDGAQRSADWALQQLVGVRKGLTPAQLRSPPLQTQWIREEPPTTPSDGRPASLGDLEHPTGLANGAGADSARTKA